MAGETRGELAEAIAKIGLRNALKFAGRREKLFWQESPDEVVIKPDFTVGTSIDKPAVVVLVNASHSPRNSTMKYWRNIGEVFDSKIRLSVIPTIFNLVFLSGIKTELIRLTEALCDSTLLVDRNPEYGDAIVEWLNENHASAPSKRKGRVALVERSLDRSSGNYDAAFASAIGQFSRHLSSVLFQSKPMLDRLWNICRTDYRARVGKSTRSSRITMLRRGLARWLVIDSDIREHIILSHVQSGRVKLASHPDHLVQLGMLHKTVADYEIPESDDNASNMMDTASRDLRLSLGFFAKAANGDPKKVAHAIDKALQDSPGEMLVAADLIRSLPSQVKHWHSYVLAAWTRLLVPQVCYQSLMECAADPTMGGKVLAASDRRVWLWDHLVAMIRTAAERNNDFGYSAMIAYFKAHLNDPKLQQLFNHVMRDLEGRELKAAERWVNKTLPNSSEPGRRGFQEWLAGTKRVSPVIVAAFAYALAGLSKSIRNPGKLEMNEVLQSHSYGLWNKLLTHHDFDPLAALIEAACGDKATLLFAPSIMGELAGATVQDAGKMPVFAFKGGLIYWQSVTQAGRDHKRKELSGRCRALKYAKSTTTFSKRKSANRMLLVVDGEWRDQDLNVLYESGWDEIFYPDEMDMLEKAL